MCAQEFTVFPSDNLYKPICLSDGHSLANSNPGETFDTCLWVLFLRIGLGKADVSDFGEGIDGVRDYIVIHLCFVSHRILGRNLSLHGSNMGQSCAVDQVTDSIDARQVCLHLLIDAYAPAIVS